MNKNEYSSRVYNSNLNNVIFLWTNLAKTFTYVKLNANTNNTQTNQYNVIHTDEQNQSLIVISTNVPKIFDKIYVCQDQSHPNRYFIGFVCPTQYTGSTIIGQIIYFDELGQVKLSSTLTNSLYSFDWRNGKVETYLQKWG